MASLLIVDDEQSICWGLSRLAQSMGHDVVTTSSVEEAIESSRTARPDVVVLDICLPGVDGLTGMSQLRELIGSKPIILVTAHGNLSTAVEAVQRGAFEYIVKPFHLEQMEQAIRRALASDVEGGPEVAAVEGFVGTTPAMQEVYNRIALASRCDASVLLYGESGTGKELAARAIHRFGSRASGPMVTVNMAALTESLAESELFGHERGAFTGADAARDGLLRAAHGGTLFLDEVGEIPLPLQVKLLRAIEQREVTAVGASQPAPADFRIVAATHRNLLKMVEDNTFRHDLYFRLAAFQIEMPPLRERREDILPLASHCLKQLTDDPPAIVDETRRQLIERPWFGNVRELRNAMQHGWIMSRGGSILPEHLPAPAPAQAFRDQTSSDTDEGQLDRLLHAWTIRQLADPAMEGKLYEALLQRVEPAVLTAVMKHNEGQLTSSSRTLGLHRTTLKKKVDRIEGQGED